ncbi:hypothetical protein B0H16DRAFT_1485143 [Mycena metata]|uniref:F-box domain-containing protein n=1 Tax=Mycena metata TaxID=1033252 RepID=A0AAD7DRA9_9AGAR|nr:hypothetical protein B0H16DRAFT_1485143 [Mycena metata]
MASQTSARKPVLLNSFPVELLSAIFVLANLPLSRHWWLFADFKLVASRVCRLWRSIVNSTSALWTALPVTRGTSADYVDYSFTRSNGAAVDVCIDLQAFLWMPGRVSDMRQRVKLKDIPAFCEKILPVLSRHDASIRRLLVKSNYVDELQDVIHSFTLTGGHHLTHLAADNELDLAPIPNIRSLALSGIRFLEPTVTFASLTSLHFTGLFLPVSWRLLSQALAAATVLQDLVIINLNCHDCDGVDPLALPSLQNFVFGCTGGEHESKILKVLEFPAVSKLTLRVVAGSLRPVAPLTKILSQIRYARFSFRRFIPVTDFIGLACNVGQIPFLLLLYPMSHSWLAEVLVLETIETFKTVSEVLCAKTLRLPRLEVIEALCVVPDDVARSLVTLLKVELFAPTSLSFTNAEIFHGRHRQHWYLDASGSGPLWFIRPDYDVPQQGPDAELVSLSVAISSRPGGVFAPALSFANELVDAYLASISNTHAARFALCAVTASLRRFVVNHARYWKYVRIRRTTRLECVIWILEHSRSLYPLHFDIYFDGIPLHITDFLWIHDWMCLVHRLDIHLTDAVALERLHSAMENCSAPALASFTLAFHVDIFNSGPNLYSPLQCRSWFRDDFPSLVDLHLTCMVLPLEDLILPVLAALEIFAVHPLYNLHVEGLHHLLACAGNLATLTLRGVHFIRLPAEWPVLVCPKISTLNLAFRNDFHAGEIFNALSFPALTHFCLRLSDAPDVFALNRLPAAYFSTVTHFTIVNPFLRRF